MDQFLNNYFDVKQFENREMSIEDFEAITNWDQQLSINLRHVRQFSFDMSKVHRIENNENMADRYMEIFNKVSQILWDRWE